MYAKVSGIFWKKEKKKKKKQKNKKKNNPKKPKKQNRKQINSFIQHGYIIMPSKYMEST